VLASEGYPGNYEINKKIKLDKNIDNDLVFHAGTKLDKKNNYLTSGGRVLNIIGFGPTLKKAIDDAYRLVDKVHFDNIFYRKDIGKKGLDY